jgi:hypothetical protein
MKDKAQKGEKLGTYINKYVRENYSAKWNKNSKHFDKSE